jgi:hypothetical protein
MKLSMIGLLVLSILCTFLPLHGKKVAVLEEVMKPWNLVIDNGQLFVSENKVIHIYNLKDFKWVKTFGKAGEGPAEFKSSPRLTPYPDYLLINTQDKVMYFSRDGEFLRETRIDYWLIGVYPAGDKFFGTKMRYDRVRLKRFKDFLLLDDSFKIVKVLTSWEMSVPLRWKKKQTWNLLSPRVFSQVYRDKFFIGDTSKGFYIEVYNTKGEKEYVINRKYKKQKVTDKYKTWRLEKMKKNKILRSVIRERKYEFPEYFPAYRYFTIMSGRIFIRLFGIGKNEGDFMLLDLKGNLLKTGTIKPDVLFTIHKDRVYYLINNEDEEVWELLVENL